MDITPEEMSRLQKYLHSKFGHTGFALKMRGQTTDSVEVLLNGEFIAIIYKNVEDGETSYDMNMSILDIDLDMAA